LRLLAAWKSLLETYSAWSHISGPPKTPVTNAAWPPPSSKLTYSPFWRVRRVLFRGWMDV